MLEHDHREDRGARAHVAGALRDGVRGDHARAGIALGRAERAAGLEVARGVKQARAVGREVAGALPRHEHVRQQVLDLPRDAVLGDARVELLDHGAVVVLRRRVDREHARGVSHGEAVLPREEPMGVARERREGGGAGHVLLAVNDGLVDVGDAPALGDVEREELRELARRDGRRGVAPGAERDEQRVIGVKRQIAVHHGRDAHGADVPQRHAVAPLHVGLERRIGALDSGDELVLSIGPVRTVEGVLPVERADGDGVVL